MPGPWSASPAALTMRLRGWLTAQPPACNARAPGNPVLGVLCSSPRPHPKTSNKLLERILVTCRRDHLGLPDHPRPGAAVHRARPGSAAARHRGQVGHHRAQRLRLRRRPGRGRPSSAPGAAEPGRSPDTGRTRHKPACPVMRSSAQMTHICAPRSATPGGRNLRQIGGSARGYQRASRIVGNRGHGHPDIGEVVFMHRQRSRELPVAADRAMSCIQSRCAGHRGGGAS